MSLEVIGNTYETMFEQGMMLYNIFNPIAENVYVKIPINSSFDKTDATDFDGIKTIKALSDKGIPINCTLVFTPEQALLAAKAGARFVSPFAGRIDDYIRSQSGISFSKGDYFPAEGQKKNNILLDLVAQIREVFDNYNINDTLVLAASIRNPRQLREAALAGADIATLPFSVIVKLLSHFKTREGMQKFTQDIVPEYAELFKKQ